MRGILGKLVVFIGVVVVSLLFVLAFTPDWSLSRQALLAAVAPAALIGWKIVRRFRTGETQTDDPRLIALSVRLSVDIEPAVFEWAAAQEEAQVATLELKTIEAIREAADKDELLRTGRAVQSAATQALLGQAEGPFLDGGWSFQPLGGSLLARSVLQHRLSDAAGGLGPVVLDAFRARVGQSLEQVLAGSKADEVVAQVSDVVRHLVGRVSLTDAIMALQEDQDFREELSARIAVLLDTVKSSFTYKDELIPEIEGVLTVKLPEAGDLQTFIAGCAGPGTGVSVTTRDAVVFQYRMDGVDLDQSAFVELGRKAADHFDADEVKQAWDFPLSPRRKPIQLPPATSETFIPPSGRKGDSQGSVAGADGQGSPMPRAGSQ